MDKDIADRIKKITNGSKEKVDVIVHKKHFHVYDMFGRKIVLTIEEAKDITNRLNSLIPKLEVEKKIGDEKNDNSI